MVRIEVHVAEGMHEVAGLQPGHLRHHLRQQGVGGDIEGHAEEKIRRTLVELAGEARLAVPPPGDMELEQAVARRERHLRNIRRVPGGDDQAPRIGVAADLGEHFGDLVDDAAIRLLPAPPLMTVNRPQLTLLVGPLIPDRDAVVPEVFDVGIAGEKPDQLVDDRFQMQLLGRDQRKPIREVEAQLRTEQRERAGAGPVLLGNALVEDTLHEVEIVFHAPNLACARKSERPGEPGLADSCDFHGAP